MPKTRTRTVRLDLDLDDAIQRRAEEGEVTANFLINKTLRKLTEWDIPGKKVGYVEVADVMVNKLIDEFEDDKCTELGRFTGREFCKPLAEILFGEFSVSTAIATFRRASLYTGRFDFDEVVDGIRHVIVFKHSQGRKWTKFYEGLVKEVLQVLLLKNVSFQCTDAICIARFEAG